MVKRCRHLFYADMKVEDSEKFHDIPLPNAKRKLLLLLLCTYSATSSVSTRLKLSKSSSYRQRRAQLVFKQKPILFGSNVTPWGSHERCPLHTTGDSLSCFSKIKPGAYGNPSMESILYACLMPAGVLWACPIQLWRDPPLNLRKFIFLNLALWSAFSW